MEKKSLKISDDKQFLIDEDGNKVRRYNKEKQAFIPLSVVLPLETGVVSERVIIRWKCYDECIRWDSNGRCLQTVRQCDPIPEWVE